MLGSISFRAFFRFAGFDAEKGHGAPCPFFVWKRIGQKQNALSGCTKSIVQEQNDSRTVAPKRLLQLSAAGERTRPLRPCVPLAVLRFWKHSGGMFATNIPLIQTTRHGTTCLYFVLWKIGGHGTACPYNGRKTPRQLCSVGSALWENSSETFSLLHVLFAIRPYFPLQFMHFT